jgi:hypothetical protein
LVSSSEFLTSSSATASFTVADSLIETSSLRR